MADVPPHLLEKAKARRAALAGGAVDTPAAASGAAESGEPSTSVATAAAAAPAVAAAAAKPKAPSAPAKEPAPPRGTRFAKMASVFLLAAVPVWGLFMYDTFATPRASADTPAARGATLFNENCSTCHGGNGSGSDGGLVGRPLWKGEVEKTFPDPIAQASFIRHGSCEIGQAYGDPKRAGGAHVGKGGMPSFAAFTNEELALIVAYERSVLSSKDFPVNVIAKVGEDATAAPAEPIVYETLKIDPATACR